MKKILIIIAVFMVFSACKKIEDFNKDTKNPENVTGESLFTGAQKNLFDQMVSSNVNQNIYRLIMQYWTETTYTDESNYDLVTRSIPDNHWDVLYRDVLKDLKVSKEVITSTTYGGDAFPQIKQNKLAIVEIMSVYTWSVLVETFGDIPYSEALDIQYKLPKYDDALTVYKDLLTRLNAAITTLDANSAVTTESFGGADNMYHGDAEAWLRFANSLKLRMGIYLAGVDASLSKSTVESAASGLLIASNNDNARLGYGTSSPNTNPIYDDLIASGRHDFVPTETIIDYMNNLNDPRMPFYFTLIDTSTTSTPAYVYYGGIPGASNDFLGYSHVSDMIQQPSFEALIFDYAEVEFLLAEAVERGFTVGGTAESHYNAGIEASILYWGGVPDSVTSYLSNPDVAYTTAPGDWKEKIGMQKWIAYYNRGFEAWSSYRKLGFPVIVAPPDALSDVPQRYTYPIAEQTLNGANYDAASAAIGGDAVGTKIFLFKN